MVVDKESYESIPFASIAIIDANNGSAVTGTVSDNTGKFTIVDLSWGRYQVLISFIGYETDSTRFVEIGDRVRQVDLETVELGISKVALLEVEIRAMAQTATTKIDRKVYRAVCLMLLQKGLVTLAKSLPTGII